MTEPATNPEPARCTTDHGRGHAPASHTVDGEPRCPRCIDVMAATGREAVAHPIVPAAASATTADERQRHLDESDGHCDGDPCFAEASATTADTSGGLSAGESTYLAQWAATPGMGCDMAYVRGLTARAVAALAAGDAELRQLRGQLARAEGRLAGYRWEAGDA